MRANNIEKEYGAKIVKEYYYNPHKLAYDCDYTIYAADNTLIVSGIRTLDRVEEECKKFEVELRTIKHSVEEEKRLMIARGIFA